MDTSTVVTQSDEALLSQFTAHGDRAALGELARRYQDRAYDLALRIVRRPSDAQDAVQNALLAVIKYSATFDRRRSFKVWFTTIVVNAARRAARQRTRQRSRSEGLADEAAADRAAPERETQMELQHYALEAVDVLPDRYRLPILLHYLQGLEVKETAGALQLRESTVRTRLSRGLQKVRERLRQMGLAGVTGGVETALRSVPCETAPSALGDALLAIAEDATPATPALATLAASQVRRLLCWLSAAVMAAVIAAVILSADWSAPQPEVPPIRLAAASEAKTKKRPTKPRPEPGPETPFPDGVWIRLGSENVEHGMKIVKAKWSDLGLPDEINGRECRQTQSALGFCLNVDDSFIFNGNCPQVSVFLTYLDQGTDTLYLGYDSLDHTAEWSGSIKRCKRIVKQNTGEWKTVRHQIADAQFGNRTCGIGDLLVCAAKFNDREHHDHIAEVRVTKESISVSTEPRFVMAGGPHEVAATVYVTDAAGRPVRDGTPVSLEAEGGTVAATVPTREGRASATLTAAAVPANVKLTAKSCGMAANASVAVVGGVGEPVDVVVPLGWFEMEHAAYFYVGGGDGEARYTIEREEERCVGRVDYTLPPNNFPYPQLTLCNVQEAPGFVRRFEIDLLGNKCRLNAQVLTADSTGEGMAFIICPAINFEGWRTVGTPLTSAAWTKGGNYDRHVDFPIRFVRLSAIQWLQNQAGSGTLKFAGPRFHCTVAESQSVWAEIGSPARVKMAELPDAGVPVPVRIVNLTDGERRLDVLVNLCKEDGPVQVLGDETLALGGKEARILQMKWRPREPGNYRVVVTVLGEIIDVEVERRLYVSGADEAH